MDSMFIGAESSASIFLILCSRAVFKQFNALYFFNKQCLSSSSLGQAVRYNLEYVGRAFWSPIALTHLEQLRDTSSASLQGNLYVF